MYQEQDMDNLEQQLAEQDERDRERAELEALERERIDQEALERERIDQEALEREMVEREMLEQDELNKAFLDQQMIEQEAVGALEEHEFDDIETELPPTVAEIEVLDNSFQSFIEGAGGLEMGVKKENDSHVNENSLTDDNQVPISAYEEFDIDDERYIDEQFSIGAGFINDDDSVFNASEAYKEYGQRSVDDTAQENFLSSNADEVKDMVGAVSPDSKETQQTKSSGKLISPSERDSIEERIADYNEISDVELASILDGEIGRERTDKFFSTIDKYLKENPEKSSAIPIDFVLKRLGYLSGKTFGSGKVTSFEGLGEKSLNISDESAVSLKPEEKSSDDAVNKNKNESQMTKGEVSASRKASGQNMDAGGGRGSILSFNFGRSPTVQSIVGADSVMKPTDSINKNYSSEARLKYTEALNNDMKSFYDLSSAAEKNNTPKNRRELSRAIQSMNQSLDKGVELLSDPSSFKDKLFLKELFNNTRAVGKKLGDLKKAKVIGEDDLSFKALMEKISALITKTLSMVAGKMGVKLGNEKGSDSGMSM